MDDITLSVELERTHQEIDGFGVNINPVAHWRDGELRSVLDLLIDDYGARLFRLDPYGSMMWPDPDNAGDSGLLSSENLAHAYRSEPFRDAWETARYLNSRGIQPVLNVSGTVPNWMCADDGKTVTDFDGYTELVASLAHWARVEEGIEFTLFGPFNETDLGPPEGPYIDPPSLANLSVMIAQRFDEQGMGDVGFVLADQAHYGLTYLKEIVRHDVLRQKMAVAGLHTYHDQDISGVPAFLQDHGMDSCRYWLTEYGDLDQTGAIEWQVALNSVRRLIRGLNDGVQGAIVWDAYDNWHDHDKAWTIWGIIRSARHLYTPKKRYYTEKQVTRFVPPGSMRLATTCSDTSIDVSAFRTTTGAASVVVLNETTTARRVSLEFNGSVPSGTFRVLETNAKRDCELTMTFPVGESTVVPHAANSITTVTSVE